MSTTNPDQQPSAFRILDLPPELLDDIASFLSKGYLLGFRQTCKQIYKHTSVAFTRCCFHTIQTDLSFESLRKLEKLAKNERFAPQVQSLLRKGRRHKHIGKGLKWERNSQRYLRPRAGSLRLAFWLLALPNPGLSSWPTCLIPGKERCSLFNLRMWLEIPLLIKHQWRRYISNNTDDRWVGSLELSLFLLMVPVWMLRCRRLLRGPRFVQTGMTSSFTIEEWA